MKRSLRITVMSALLLAVVAPSIPALDAASDEEEGRMLAFSIDLALFDGVGLTDDSRSNLMREAEAIFAGIGVHVTWLDRVGSPEVEGRSDLEVKVILSSVRPSSWGYKENALGIVLAPHWDTVFVFARTIAHTIGSGNAAGRRSLAAVAHDPKQAQAMARVLVHEVVHTVAREHDHADAGIMRGSQSYRTLVSETASLDGSCARAFRTGLILLAP